MKDQSKHVDWGLGDHDYIPTFPLHDQILITRLTSFTNRAYSFDCVFIMSIALLPSIVALSMIFFSNVIRIVDLNTVSPNQSNTFHLLRTYFGYFIK